MKANNKLVIGYAYVCCDILNIGHLKHLRSCKSLCDKLIVGVLTDSAICERKVRPILSFGERLETVQSIKFVDTAIKQETYSPLPNVFQLQPDILFESTSHREEDFIQAREEVAKYGGKVLILPYFD